MEESRSRVVGQGLGLDGRVVVRRARCGTRRRDRVAVRDAVERLDPDTGLARSAILVVRRLQGVLVGNPPRLEGVQLRTVAAGARRVGIAPPPPDCDAVLFADEAELLACLCRDAAADRPLGWWWTTLLGRSVVTSPQAHQAAVAAAFGRFVRALPAATAAAPRAVAIAAAKLPAGEVLRITGAMCVAHGAGPLAEAVKQVWLAAAPGRGPGPASASVSAATSAPAADVVPAGRTGPAIAPAAALVGLLVDAALHLHRDPVGARSVAAAETYAVRAAEATRGREVGRGPPRPGVVLDGAPPPASRPASAHQPAGEATSALGATVDSGRSTDAVPADARVPAGGTRSTGATSVEAPGGPDPAPVVTALGGAFYLLNLLEELDLPDSADGPGEPGALLTRWGVLALVLRAWPGVDVGDPLLACIDGLAWPGVDPGDPGALAAALHPDEPWVYRPPAAVRAELDGSWSADVADVAEVAEGAGALGWGEQVAGALAGVLGRRGLGAGVVQVPAQVACTGFSVRVLLALDDVDLGVRRAGLDRDPGWVPALGRVVELIFR